MLVYKLRYVELVMYECLSLRLCVREWIDQSEIHASVS